jgi:Bacteriophage abortive infection AbiH
MPKPDYCPLIRRAFKKLKGAKILCIIGNGFDLHHGIKSSYWNFRNFIADKNEDLLDILEQYLDRESLWSDFEATLARLDIDALLDDAGQYLVSYSAEDWKDRYNHDYKYEIDKVTSAITEKMKAYFTEWILNLAIPSSPGDEKINLPKDARFLTFNYTSTLEKTYRIPGDCILYLHNKAIEQDSLLILGHGRKPEPPKPLTPYQIELLEDRDPRVNEGDRIIDDYFASTYKSTEQVIQTHRAFFTSLKNITDIHVLGHSLSEVDLEYFWTIALNTRRNCVRWKVSFHKKEEIEEHRAALASIGVPPKAIAFYRLPQLYSIQRSLF